MRYLVWALRLLVFVAVLMFALKNTEPVAVKFYADYVVQNVPLIVVMLATFVVGALFGLLLAVPAVMRRRREATRLRREVERLQAQVNGGPAPAPAAVAPESVAPMSPL
ncbi:lipopolysaccharide assembly LapA domain-containing protein [Bordetella genomosp. 13]|uniref:LapA family protein n=1 Tax=Bordetella genomosp. 13 TaxID=463040 RepID=UPI00119D9EAA|nr:LapA family protein [Bordetella genomosp. 13]